MFLTEFVEKIKTRVIKSVFFLRKSFRLRNSVGKYSRSHPAAGHRRQYMYNSSNALYMPDNYCKNEDTRLW